MSHIKAKEEKTVIANSVSANPSSLTVSGNGGVTSLKTKDDNPFSKSQKTKEDILSLPTQKFTASGFYDSLAKKVHTENEPSLIENTQSQSQKAPKLLKNSKYGSSSKFTLENKSSYDTNSQYLQTDTSISRKDSKKKPQLKLETISSKKKKQGNIFSPAKNSINSIDYNTFKSEFSISQNINNASIKLNDYYTNTQQQSELRRLNSPLKLNKYMMNDKTGYSPKNSGLFKCPKVAEASKKFINVAKSDSAEEAKEYPTRIPTKELIQEALSKVQFVIEKEAQLQRELEEEERRQEEERKIAEEKETERLEAEAKKKKIVNTYGKNRAQTGGDTDKSSGTNFSNYRSALFEKTGTKQIREEESEMEKTNQQPELVEIDTNRLGSMSGNEVEDGQISRRVMAEDNAVEIAEDIFEPNEFDKLAGPLDKVCSIEIEGFEYASIIERVEKLIVFIENENKEMRLGAIVGLYLIKLKQYNLEADIDNQILQGILKALSEYDIQDENFLVICLKIISFYTPCEDVSKNVNTICMFITDFNYPLLQETAFKCLITCGLSGIKLLIELAVKDQGELQSYILTKFINTPHFIKNIICKALVNDLDTYEKANKALAALCRLYDYANLGSDYLKKLCDLLRTSKLDKSLLATAIRLTGVEGEKALVEELRVAKDKETKLAILAVLSHRIEVFPKYLHIQLTIDQVSKINTTVSYDFYTYYGKVTSPLNSTTANGEYLEINKKDLIGTLQRMVNVKIDHTNPNTENLSEMIEYQNLMNSALEKNSLDTKFNGLFKIDVTNYEDINQYYPDKKHYLRKETVLAVMTSLSRDLDMCVKEAAASCLGQLGLPEGITAIDSLVRAIQEPENSIELKAMTIWAIGRLADGCEDDVINVIVECLKSNVYKIKSISLFALGEFGERKTDITAPALVKLLKDCSLNRQTVAETILKLGHEGERVVLKLISESSAPGSDPKIKASLLLALSTVKIESPNIDFIVETLYRCSQNGVVISVRKGAIQSLKLLFDKAREARKTQNINITYLKEDFVLQFFYKLLKDKDYDLQCFALQMLRECKGEEAESILLEGITQDPNSGVRCHCALGLAELGIKFLRNLLIALSEKNETVVKCVEKIILRYFTIENIKQKPNYMLSSLENIKSLRVNLNVVIETNKIIGNETRDLLRRILMLIDSEKEKERRAELIRLREIEIERGYEWIKPLVTSEGENVNEKDDGNLRGENLQEHQEDDNKEHNEQDEQGSEKNENDQQGEQGGHNETDNNIRSESGMCEPQEIEAEGEEQS